MKKSFIVAQVETPDGTVLNSAAITNVEAEQGVHDSCGVSDTYQPSVHSHYTFTPPSSWPGYS